MTTKITTETKRGVRENTPWDIVTDARFAGQVPYSGTLLKCFRVSKGWNQRYLAARLGITRVSALVRLETLGKIGIKRAKEFAKIFNIPDYRIFRDIDRLHKYSPSDEERQAMEEVVAYFKELGVNFITTKKYTLTSDGKPAIKVLVKTQKRKFVDTIRGISLIVEKQ